MCVLYAVPFASIESRLPDITLQQALQTCVQLILIWAQKQLKSSLIGSAESKAETHDDVKGCNCIQVVKNPATIYSMCVFAAAVGLFIVAQWHDRNCDPMA